MPMYQLGIDVSKNTLDLCLLREGIKGRIKTRKLKNTADAAKVVAEWLKKQSCELGEVHIIMEATGVYHEPLAYGLHFAGARISLANPHRTREFARGMNILTKNDKVDAWMLACYGSLKELRHGLHHQNLCGILELFYAAETLLLQTAPEKKTDLKNLFLQTALMPSGRQLKTCFRS